MKWLVIGLLASIPLSGCMPELKVAKVDNGGLIQAKEGRKLGQADVTKNTKFPLNHYKEMAFFSSNQYYFQYGYDQLKSFNHFNQVLKYNDLEKIVIANNLQDKVINLDSQIGLSRFANNYQPFLWIRLYPKQENNKNYLTLVVTNPVNAEDLFEARTSHDGQTDEALLYPLFNALSVWIKENQ
jgi:hypothetical protein